MSEPKKLRIHLLIRDQGGAVQSNADKTAPKLGKGGRFCVACDPSITMGELDRGTADPWGVRCEACMAIEAFKAIDRPKPGQAIPDRSEETPSPEEREALRQAEGKPCGGCK